MFEKNPIYMYIYGYNLEKKCEESGFLLLCIKFVFYKKKKKKTSRRLQAKNFLAQITRVSSFDEVSPLNGWNLSRNSVSPDLTERS